jgi:hypothetical protein
MNCIPLAFSQILCIPLADIIAELGHDGSEIINNDPEPLCRRGFHPQELVYYCYNHGYLVVNFHSDLRQYDRNDNEYVFGVLPIHNVMAGTSGVLVGTVKGRFHAVGWRNDHIIDGTPLSEFQIDEYYMVLKLES